MKFDGSMKTLMKQAMRMKEQMQKIQDETGEKLVQASSGGGMVTVTAKARGEITSIKIEPEVVDNTDIDMLQDLIVAAVNSALSEGQKVMKDETSKITGGLGLPPGLI